MAESDRNVPRRALIHGYEPTDVHVGRIAWVGPGLVVIILAFGAAVWGMTEVFQALRPPDRATAIETSSRPIPGPRLQANPAGDLAALREHESQILTSYGWVERQRGIARIPIDRAMALLAERGWPRPTSPASARETPATPPAPPSAPEGRQP